MEAIGPAVLAKRIQLQRAIEPNAVVLGDPGRLQQTLWNLLLNAVKFTPAGGRVEIRLASVQSQIEVAVTDSGMGIAPEFLPHVFDRFSQADSSMRRQHGGLGLELSIARSRCSCMAAPWKRTARASAAAPASRSACRARW